MENDCKIYFPKSQKLVFIVQTLNFSPSVFTHTLTRLTSQVQEITKSLQLFKTLFLASNDYSGREINYLFITSSQRKLFMKQIKAILSVKFGC